MAQAVGKTRIVSIEDKLVLTELKRAKPQYAPYIAAIQAAANEFIAPMGFLAYGIVGNLFGQEVVDAYLHVAEPEFQRKISPLGVTVQFSVLSVGEGLQVSWTATKGVGEPGAVPSDSDSYLIKGLAEDFSDDWAESLALAVSRWSRFVNTLTPEVADEILKAAQVGYEEFMTDRSPTPEQLTAAIKHKVRLLAVDRNFYVNRIKGAVQKYQTGYQEAKAKYAEVFKYVGDALYAATKLTISIFKVL